MLHGVRRRITWQRVAILALRCALAGGPRSVGSYAGALGLQHVHRQHGRMVPGTRLSVSSHPPGHPLWTTARLLDRHWRTRRAGHDRDRAVDHARRRSGWPRGRSPRHWRRCETSASGQESATRRMGPSANGSSRSACWSWASASSAQASACPRRAACWLRRASARAPSRRRSKRSGRLRQHVHREDYAGMDFTGADPNVRPEQQSIARRCARQPSCPTAARRSSRSSPTRLKDTSVMQPRTSRLATTPARRSRSAAASPSRWRACRPRRAPTWLSRRQNVQPMRPRITS